MRRGLAAALLGISLWVGSLAWSGFIMANTVLDPGRSERVADSLLRDSNVRNQIAQSMGVALAETIPGDLGVDRDEAVDAADAALDSDAVNAVVYDALVASHQALLGEGEPPRSIESGAFASAARDELIRSRPDLAGIVPEAPSFQIPLPTSNMPNLGPVRDAVNTAVPILAGLAAAGVLLALVVAKDRPAVIRRAGYWAIALAALVLLLAYGLPVVVERFLSGQSAVIVAVIDALAASLRLPALILAGAGAGAVGLSYLWKSTANAGPGGRPASPTGQAPRPAGPGTGALRGERARRAAAAAGQQGASRSRPGSAGSSSGPATPPQGTPPAAASPAARTVLTPVPESGPDGVGGAGSAADGGQVVRDDARWVQGVGWVHEGSGPIPDNARFEPGIGYVLDD